ncbi:MAG: glycosyltransferase family 4 protein [Pseudomonadota bacterium]
MPNTPKRPRVLAIAEAANPEWVSVPLVGWSLAHALREVADVHLVTHIRNRDAILRAGYSEGKDVTFINSEALDRPVWRLSQALRMGGGKGWTVVTALKSLSYPYFERLVWRRFGAAIRAGEFDIVHRITPLTPTAPSRIAAKCRAAGVPFVLGPLNGGVPWPPGYGAERRQEREWLSYIRGAYKMSRGRVATARAAAAIFAGSQHTAGELPPDAAGKVFHLPENAIDPARFNRVAAQSPESPLRGAFVGRLVPYKGPDMLIEAAMPLLQAGTLTLDIVGEGPLAKPLQEAIRAGGIEGAVTLHGRVDHARVQDILVDAHLLTFPSIREFGGGVVLEAMALGVVPLIVDYAGPGELVAPETGLKIPVAPRAELVAAFRTALEHLADDRDSLPALALNARTEVAAHYTWAAKARKVAAVYDWVRNAGAERPDLSRI